MTENKRFEYIEATDWVDEHIIDHNTEPRFEHYFLKSVTDKMNMLDDENQKLKEENEQLKNELARQQLINTSMKTEKGIDKLQSKIKELIDENVRLKSVNMEYEDALGRLEEENKQTKQSLNNCKHEIHHLKHEQKCLLNDITFMTAPQAKELVKENEQLKHMIQEAYETERTQIGKNVLKQLMEQIQ